MIKRLDNINSYKYGNFIVTIESIRNDVYGNHRYRATIINSNSDSYSAPVYIFSSHCFGEANEAAFILKHHLGASALKEYYKELYEGLEKLKV